MLRIRPKGTAQLRSCFQDPAAIKLNDLGVSKIWGPCCRCMCNQGPIILSLYSGPRMFRDSHSSGYIMVFQRHPSPSLQGCSGTGWTAVPLIGRHSTNHDSLYPPCVGNGTKINTRYLCLQILYYTILYIILTMLYLISYYTVLYHVLL